MNKKEKILDIMGGLEDIALDTNTHLYIKIDTSLVIDDVLKFIFFCPVTGKSKYLEIDVNKFCIEQFSHIKLKLMENITPKYVKNYSTDSVPRPIGFPEDDDPIVRYCKEDVKAMLNMFYGTHNMKPQIEKVIFNDPATIVFWSDGTKTIVQSRGDDTFDPEKGLAMAISKKFLGNNHDYYEVFQKHVGRYEKAQRKKEEAEAGQYDVVKAMKNLKKAFEKFNDISAGVDK